MTDPDELNHARAREPRKSQGGQRAIKWEPRVAAIAARRHIHIHTAATTLHLHAELASQLTARVRVAPGRLQRETREGVGGGTAPSANVGSHRRATAGQIQLFNTTNQKGKRGRMPRNVVGIRNGGRVIQAQEGRLPTGQLALFAKGLSQYP